MLRVFNEVVFIQMGNDGISDHRLQPGSLEILPDSNILDN